ncbi:unnamed protein product [Gordionus sp. m RMFG-2023]
MSGELEDNLNQTLQALISYIPELNKQGKGVIDDKLILRQSLHYLKYLQGGSSVIDTGGILYPDQIAALLIKKYNEGYSECVNLILDYLIEIEQLDVLDCRVYHLIGYLKVLRQKWYAAITHIILENTKENLHILKLDFNKAFHIIHRNYQIPRWWCAVTVFKQVHINY